MPRFSDYSPTSLYGGGAVHVAATNFGTFDGTGTNDMLAQFQAADAARISQGKQTLILPAGARMKLSASFTPGGGTCAIVSEDYFGNSTGQRTAIEASFNNAPAIIFSSGSRKHFYAGFNITSSVSAQHVLLRDKGGCGVGVHSGASDLEMDRMWIDKFYNGVMTSYDFADSTAEKIVLNNVETECAIDVHVAKLQNRGMMVRDSRLKGVTNLLAFSEPNIIENFHGGPGNGSSATFTIADVSVQKVTPGATYYCHFYDFASSLPYVEVTMTIAGSPTSLQLAMLAADGGGSDMPYIMPSAYQALGVLTDHYGVVPMTPISYDDGTGALVARIWPYWLYQNFSTSVLTETDLGDEIEAGTTLYASTWGHLVHSNGFHLCGGHSELSGGVVTIAAKSGYGGGGHSAKVEQYELGYGISGHGDATPVQELQKVFSYFCQHADGVFELDRVRQSDPATTKVNFDQKGTFESRTIVNRCPSFIGKFNERILSNGNFNAGGSAGWNVATCKAYGGFESDVPMHCSVSTPVGGGQSFAIRRSGWMQSPYKGSRPALSAIPQMAPGLVTKLAAFTGGIGTFPMPFGRRLYQKISALVAVATIDFIAYDHEGLTYGKDFDGAGGNWNRIGFTARGGSPFIALDDDTSGVDALKAMQEGWGLLLNNGSTDDLYICAGFDPDTLTVFVVRASDSTIQGFNGTAGAEYTGNVKQQAFTPIL